MSQFPNICWNILVPVLVLVLLNGISFDWFNQNGHSFIGQVQGQIFTCTPQYCFSYGNCPPFSCKGKNQIVLRNSTECGCCNLCIDEIEEGAQCQTSMIKNVPGTQCGPHLRCTETTKNNPICTKISKIKSSGCEYTRMKIEQNPSRLIASMPKPECDEYGNYLAKQCKNGTLCQCVNEEGSPIFGMAPYNKAKDMNCLCSRQFENVNQKLKQFQMEPIDPIHFMRCQENGNFESFQYHRNYTYCLDVENNTLVERAVGRAFAYQLPCYDKRYRYSTKCIDNYNKEVDKINKLLKAGFMVVGHDLPNCDLDGTFAPVQCFNNDCYCVNKNGEKYRNTKVDRNTEIAKEQSCTCVRKMEMIRNITPIDKKTKVTEIFSRSLCDKNGNFLPLQCSDSVCYCVDKQTGFTINKDNSPTPLRTQHDAIRGLQCYKDYPEQSYLDSQLGLTF